MNQLKPFNDYPVTWVIGDIVNSLIGDWRCRCETHSISAHACAIRVHRDGILLFTYQIEIQLHPERGFPVVAVEAVAADGVRVRELLFDGRHIDNLKGIQLHQHFFYMYGRLCGAAT